MQPWPNRGRAWRQKDHDRDEKWRRQSGGRFHAWVGERSVQKDPGVKREEKEKRSNKCGKGGLGSENVVSVAGVGQRRS